jgi:hypothetical protein
MVDVWVILVVIAVIMVLAWLVPVKKKPDDPDGQTQGGEVDPGGPSMPNQQGLFMPVANAPPPFTVSKRWQMSDSDFMSLFK